MKRKQKITPKVAEGRPAVSEQWRDVGKVTPDNVAAFACNIHIADQVNNQTRQVYPAPPEVWVTDADGETHQELTKWLREQYDALDCFDIQKCVLPDTYLYGCMPYSVGITADNGHYEVSEIRRLPPESFIRAPPVITTNVITPNPLMPGIIIDEAGTIQAWQTDTATGTQQQVRNVQFVRAPGTPTPSGAAYLYPAYFVIARMEFAAAAQIQQVARIGAPRMIPKVADTVTDEEYEALKRWFGTMGKFWEGKNNSILIPPGIEFPTLNIREGTTAQEFVEQCVAWIREYCNPMSDMASTGSLGQSDSGRMEMWSNFIASEQTLSERWLEDIFNSVLDANGWAGYTAHIELKRPSVDRSAIKLQALQLGVSAGALTTEEIRDNLTDTLEIQEWDEEVQAQLRAAQSNSLYQTVVQNSEMGKTITNPEERIMEETARDLREIYATGAERIKELLEEK